MMDKDRRRAAVIESVRRHHAGDSKALELLVHVWQEQARFVRAVKMLGQAAGHSHFAAVSREAQNEK